MTMPYTVLAALAQNTQKGGGSAASFLPLVLLFAVFYFLMIRPQQRKARDHRALMGALKQGDKVVAAGGIVGTIRRVDDDVIQIQVADNVVLKVDKATVARKLETT